MTDTICPLMFAGQKFEACQHEKCAWWDKHGDQCSLKSLGEYASDQVRRLEK